MQPFIFEEIIMWRSKPRKYGNYPDYAETAQFQILPQHDTYQAKLDAVQNMPSYVSTSDECVNEFSGKEGRWIKFCDDSYLFVAK